MELSSGTAGSRCLKDINRNLSSPPLALLSSVLILFSGRISQNASKMAQSKLQACVLPFLADISGKRALLSQ